MLSGGKHDIDVDDLRKNTRYTGGYTEGSRTISIFWEVKLAEWLTCNASLSFTYLTFQIDFYWFNSFTYLTFFKKKKRGKSSQNKASYDIFPCCAYVASFCFWLGDVSYFLIKKKCLLGHIWYLLTFLLSLSAYTPFLFGKLNSFTIGARLNGKGYWYFSAVPLVLHCRLFLSIALNL